VINLQEGQRALLLQENQVDTLSATHFKDIMPPKTNAHLNLPLSYYNPDNKCWFIALMTSLSFYGPFHEILSKEDNLGPVTMMLKDHFKSPPLRRNEGNNKLIDTPKALRNLRGAVETHLDKNPNSPHAEQLLHMVGNTGLHDPGEAWNLINGIVSDELGINQLNSHIGVQVNEFKTCTKCNKTRMTTAIESQYLQHAIQLNALATLTKPSVQKAIQQYFAPEKGVQQQCGCDGPRNTAHTKFLRCQKGVAGLVFYCQFHPEHLS
jgi:hypothetical protein